MKCSNVQVYLWILGKENPFSLATTVWLEDKCFVLLLSAVSLEFSITVRWQIKHFLIISTQIFDTRNLRFEWVHVLVLLLLFLTTKQSCNIIIKDAKLNWMMNIFLQMSRFTQTQTPDLLFCWGLLQHNDDMVQKEQKFKFNMTKQQILFDDFTLPVGSQRLLRWKLWIFITLMKKYLYKCKMMDKFLLGNQFKQKLTIQ